MKFDISRAWKDEAYRQTLSAEELEMLEANPVGELDEIALAEVVGGDFPSGIPGGGPGGGFLGGSAGSASSSASSAERHTHSWSLLCDINVFSIDASFASAGGLLNIATCRRQICIHRG